jgi:hypothetical protein
MSTIVNPSIWERIPEFRKDYQEARPFPHFVVENFLDEPFSRKLFREFPSFDRDKATDEHGRTGGKAVREDLSQVGPSYAELDRLFSSRKFLEWMSHATEIPGLLYDPAYVGGGTHENLPGQDLSVHIDFNYHPTEGWHRRLNALLYLNPEWEESWGGALELWKNPWDAPSKNEIRKIAPVWNRLVVFGTSETSWHGFEKVSIPEHRQKEISSRKSVAIYLYSKERPKHETNAMHSTVYYERPLPETIVANQVISKQDWDEMLRLTIRRDELLKLLYKRETQFSQSIERLAASLAESGGLRAFRMAWHQESRDENKIMAERLGPDRYQVRTGLLARPLVGPGFKIETEAANDFTPGDWVLLGRPEEFLFELVRVVKKIGGIYLCWSPARAGARLLPRSAIGGRVVKIHDEGLVVNTRHPLPKISLKTLCSAHFFVTFHRWKNRLLGSRKSPFLWWLSSQYRNFLHGLGMEAPVLFPEGKDSRNH